MEDHPNCILDCPYLYKEKNLDIEMKQNIEELKQSLWLTTLELEANRLSVQEQIISRDNQLNQLKNLLNNAVNERNEAQNNYQSLLHDKILLQNQFYHQKTISCVVDEPIIDYEENIVSCTPNETAVHVPAPTIGLPENGKFLEAVMKAGPLLQNLLMAGSLPDWQKPPPRLDVYQIPSPPHHLLSQEYLQNASSNCYEFNKKRRFSQDSISST